MALILADRVQETCNSPGTGTVTLLGAQTGFQSFSAGVGNGNTTFYAIANQIGGNWEVGLGTYSSTGNTLARTTVLASSNAGSLTNFSSGIQNVWVDYPAGKAVNLDASGYVDAGGNPYLTFSPQSSNPTAATGLVWYDQTKDSLSYYNATGYEINIGQQVDQVCYNNTGSTIPAGTAIYLSGGSSGNYPYITPAIATSQSTANMVGITGQSIANGSTGIVVILGEIFSYNTTGMTAGQTLYLSPTTAGALTTTQPASPFYAVRAGFVVVGGSSTGIIFASVRNVYTLGSNIISPVSFTAFSTSSNVLQLYGYSSSQIADLIDIWTYSGGNKAFAINNAGAIYAGTWNGSTIGTAYGGTGLTALGAGVQTALGNAVSGSGNFALTTSPTLVTPILGTPQSGNFSTGTFTWPTFNQNTTGQAGSVASSVTFNNGGAGAASGITFNGSAAQTISYNTVGAPSTTGTSASGTWGISVTGSSGSCTGNAATATTASAVSANAITRTMMYCGSNDGAAVLCGSDGAIFTNPKTITANTVIPANYGAHSVGPMIINSGVTVTVNSGSKWVIF